MILNPEKLNITEEQRQALTEIFKQCVLDYLQIKNFDLRSTTHDFGITKFPHSEKFCS